MRRILGFLICLVLLAAACNKTSTPTLTAAQQLEKDINLIDEYLAANNINAIRLDNGIRYVIKEMGDGAVVNKDNCVRFRYEGRILYDTAVFGRNTTDGLKSPLKSLVGGMQIGMKLMPVGTKGTIFMPSVYGYGTAGLRLSLASPYIVPPNTCIWFDVEILQLYDYNSLGNYCYE